MDENKQQSSPNHIKDVGIAAASLAGVGVVIEFIERALITRAKPLFAWRELGKRAVSYAVFGALASGTAKLLGLEDKHRGDTTRSFAAGAITGAGAMVTEGLVMEGRVKGRAVAWAAAIVGVLYGLISRFKKKSEMSSDSTPPTPPTPPAFGERPNGLGLATIPQILDILVAQGDITAEQHAKILADIKGGRKGFAAQMAVEDGFTTAEKADAALARQGMMKAEAAVQDIQNIKDYGTLPAPVFLKANWGNNGVNPAAAAPTRTDGISAAANAAQNLVMLANANPALAPQLFNGVIAAASLANGIANGDSPVTPIGKMANTWQQTMNDALTAAAAASPQSMVDANGKPINVQDFIAARGAEISAAVTETLKNPPQQGKGNAR